MELTYLSLEVSFFLQASGARLTRKMFKLIAHSRTSYVCVRVCV